MNSIVAILQPDATGTLHLTLPRDVWDGKGKVRVVATALGEERGGTSEDNERRQRELTEIMARIRTRNPLGAIVDPVSWQREVREDRSLPARD